jgi:hypothetical protein
VLCVVLCVRGVVHVFQIFVYLFMCSSKAVQSVPWQCLSLLHDDCLTSHVVASSCTLAMRSFTGAKNQPGFQGF